eukprot:TRINITY_DN10264_c0_g1_i11.p1 TRINITY_DN10264_c0_g1~~TRINITY_DN10264_c0_g1_i11.p1  ORF type:complete len:163 (-),score=36.40 TRINITY_DN10264_c0_g1_i11:10-498(-)
MMSMAMVTVLAALLIPATLGFFDPRALVTGSGAEIDPNLPEEVRERQAAFHYFEDRYFQITEVDPVGGEYSKEASDALDGMIAAAPFKSAPNLMKAMLLVVQAMAVSYTHLRAHETPEHLVCRLLLEKKKKKSCQYEIDVLDIDISKFMRQMIILLNRCAPQ